MAGTGGGPPAGVDAAGGGRRRRRRGSRSALPPRSPGEERQLELQPEPADAGPVRVDGDEPAGDVGERSGVRGRRVDEPSADDVDDLVEQRARIAAAVLERIEDGDAGRDVTGQQRLDEPIDRGGVGHAEQLANGGFGDGVGRRRQQLVEDRLGVPHAAGGESRDQRQAAPARSLRPSASRMRVSLPSISGTVRRRTS